MVILTTYAGVIHVSPVFQRLSGGCGALSPLDGFPSTTGISRSKLRQGNRTRCCSDDMRPGLPGNVFRVHATTHGGNGRGRTSDLYLIRALLCLLSYITMAGEEERPTSFISTRKRAYRTPHICVSVLSFPRITGFGTCVGRRLPWWQLRLPRYCQSPGVLL